MTTIGLGRLNPLLKGAEADFFRRLGFEPVEIDKPEDEVPGTKIKLISTLGAVSVSTAFPDPAADKSGESMTINYDWSPVIRRFRKVDPRIPVVLTSSGTIPIEMMKAMLAAKLEVDLKVVNVLDASEVAEDDPLLGLPFTFLLVKEAWMKKKPRLTNEENSEEEALLKHLKAVLHKHCREICASNGT